jgi:hypothetical protein
MGLADWPGIFLGDEIWNSHTDEQARAHADGIVANMFLHKIGWVAQQINDSRGREAIQYLMQASQRRGWGSVGSWAQGMEAQIELDRASQYGSQFHIANVESPHEDSLWRTQDVVRAATLFPNGMFGVIFTEGAWGRDPAKSQRWRDAGAMAIPEAIQSENPQATIPAMLELAQALGWPASRTGPCVYLTRAYAASNYNATIGQTAGRWSVFRYGDIDQVDWDQINLWPRPSAPAPPPPPPPTPGDPVYAELDRIVGLFRAGSPNIAKAFDEVKGLLIAKDARIIQLEHDLDELNSRLLAAADVLVRDAG